MWWLDYFRLSLEALGILLNIILGVYIIEKLGNRKLYFIYISVTLSILSTLCLLIIDVIDMNTTLICLTILTLLLINMDASNITYLNIINFILILVTMISTLVTIGITFNDTVFGKI